MTNQKLDSSFLRKIKFGLDVSFKKLVAQKQQTNGELIFSENGKIITIKADELAKYLKNKSK